MPDGRTDLRPTAPESLVQDWLVPDWLVPDWLVQYGLVGLHDSLPDTGVVADARQMISVAGVDLISIGVRASIDAAGCMMPAPSATVTTRAGLPLS